MKLVSSQPVMLTYPVGRMSDGSDRTTATLTTWNAVVLDDDGMTRNLSGLTFDPSLPANYGSLLTAVAAAVFVTPVTKAAWKTAIRPDIDDWWRLHNCRLNAQTLGLPSAQIAFIQNLENAAWTQVVNDFTAYSNAT